MKRLLLLSGGMDSATMLGTHIHQKYDVRCVAFNYGQRHVRELDSALLLAAHYNVPITTVDIQEVGLAIGGGSALMGTSDQPVPHGHYEDETMQATVVPCRNLVLLSVAAGMAAAQGIEVISYGAHAGDHAIYPDCRPEFIQPLKAAIRKAHYTPIELHAPFESLTKTDILTVGLNVKVPYELTWTCYEGGEKPCGKCGSCVERAEAFEQCGATDPLLS
jgi:7-cyano-7-deazaguanine synthase